MGVGLQPLEFADCLTDSPQFRENLQKHEKELEKTSQQIKRLIKEVKDMLQAAKRLSSTQLALATSLEQFEFECIGQSMTEDELVISRSLSQFAQLIRTIEDERERMLGRAYDQIIQPLERFRKDHIGAVKEGKKKFEKKTAKFCQSQERNLNLSTKKQDNVFQEADALMDMAERDFCQASLEYVFLLQEVHERKKFEFVEILLGFIFGWWTFYHQGHEVHQDAKPYMQDLQLRIQKSRSNFEETSKKTESLMKKMMEMRQMNKEDPSRPPFRSEYTRAGYLYLMEKKAFGTTWTKQYCTYTKTNKEFTMTPFNQISVKTVAVPDMMTLASCVRRTTESIDKRFCFDVTAEGRPGIVYTLQALSEADRKAWLDAMDGKEPTYENRERGVRASEERALDEAGFAFVQRCVQVIEARGLEEQGLYRVAGVSSKVSKLLAMGLDRRRGLPANLDDPYEWETKTITSALKNYLRSLPEPLCTHRYHNGFIAAAKQENRVCRVNDVHTLVHRLPKQNFDMLDIVIRHLRNVVAKSDKNLMSVANVAVCFGPTLLRPEEETVAAIMDLKFYNVVVEILIDNYERIFRSPPPAPPPPIEKVNGHIRTPPAGAPTSLPPESRIVPRNIPITHGIPMKPYYESGVAPGPNAIRKPNSSGHQFAPLNRPYSPPGGTRYSPHHQHLLQQLAGGGGGGSELHRDLLNSTSSSNESVSSASSLPLDQSLQSAHSLEPPHPVPHRRTAYYAAGYRPHPPTIGGGSVVATRSHSPTPTPRRVRTLYACLGESEGELSFEPNQIITNVKSSAEPGWLEGTLNGKTGLVPENYVEALP